MIQDSRRRGGLNQDHINGPAAGRVFLQAAAEPEARATDDADCACSAGPTSTGSHWASYLTACGLAQPLAPALAEPPLHRAPAFFTEALRAAAVRDGSSRASSSRRCCGRSTSAFARSARERCC